MPDGTSIGGLPSNLQQTLNAHFATADWQAQFGKAFAVWEKVANVNFSLVSDNGANLGVSGNQQNDARFGDIRIGGYAMSGSILAVAYLPPSANGGTDAGDLFINTSQSWQINGTTYDLMTVAIHEIGHALGMAHSTDTSAAMYPAYTTTKEAVDSDDIAGIRSLYNSRQQDSFNPNHSSSQAADITSYLDGNGQLQLPALDITPTSIPGQGDPDWFKITVPSTTQGTMVVKMQATGLSLLAPTLAVFNSTGTTLLGSQSSSSMGDTVAVTLNKVSSGQVYLIRCTGTTTGDSGFGAFGLEVNLGSKTQPAISPPDTTVAQQPDKGGGTMSETSGSAGLRESTNDPDASQVINIGNVTGAGDALMASDSASSISSPMGSAGAAPWTPLWRPQLMAPLPKVTSVMDQSIQSLLSPLDFFTNSDPSITISPPFLLSRNRRSEPTQNEFVDRAIDEWSVELLR
jgi:hypothetical protein